MSRLTIKDVLIKQGTCVSMGEVRRLVFGGAVKVDDITALRTSMPVEPGQLVRIGKHMEFRVENEESGGKESPGES